MSPKSDIAARLVRALALRLRVCAASTPTIIHVAGKENDIADIPSRSFLPSSRWHCPDDKLFLTRFAERFPLPQGAFWQLFHPSNKLTTKVISELLMQQSPMEGWLRLPPKGRVIGTTGAPTANRWGLTPTSTPNPTAPSSAPPLALLDGLGRASTVMANKSLVQEYKLRCAPSARPANWTEGKTPSTGRPTATSSTSNSCVQASAKKTPSQSHN